MDRPVTLSEAVTRMADRVADYYLSMAWHSSRRHVKQAFCRMAEHVKNEGKAAVRQRKPDNDAGDMRVAFTRMGGRGLFSSELSRLTGVFQGDFRGDEDVVHHAIRFNQDCLTFLGEWRRIARSAEAILGIAEWVRIHEGHFERLNAILDLSTAVSVQSTTETAFMEISEGSCNQGLLERAC
ncbi:MAG: hypothetical protein ACYS47_02545 [Planctomycetota bacterium]|jgi:hypothetical protein